MANSKSIEIWEKAWKQEVHTTEYALKRIKSAKSAKLTPIKIDTTDFYGYFQGSHGRYETFLDNCPCGDFHRSKLPCKHIYRLAMELGVLNSDFDTNPNAILTPKAERISLDDTIDMVEHLSADAQLKLLKIAVEFKSADSGLMIFLDQITVELLNSGLIVESDPPKHEIKFGKKNEIAELLKKENIPYDVKSKKGELENLCLRYIPEKAKEQFGISICVNIPAIFSSQSIHYYLHRKYETAYFYDGNINFTDIPLLETVLPDDHITDQLIKHGYYSRK